MCKFILNHIGRNKDLSEMVVYIFLNVYYYIYQKSVQNILSGAQVKFLQGYQALLMLHSNLPLIGTP